MDWHHLIANGGTKNMARSAGAASGGESENQDSNTNNESQDAGAASGTAAQGNANQAGGDDNRFITITVPEGDPVTTLGENPLKAGEQLALSAGAHKRVDYIRALAKTGEWTRGDIAKQVTKLQYGTSGRKVPYQIVFQATRGIPNVKKAPRGDDAPANQGSGSGEQSQGSEQSQAE
jgi:hypothetical protein